MAGLEPLDVNINGLKMKTIKMHKFGRVSIHSQDEIDHVEIFKKKPSPDDADATTPQELPIDQEFKPNLALDSN
jgi:hypothetical protein